ncbi:hypothetical protein KR074_012600 [Drosophila pseudoananassae]|nr:hypothetical protein KR074_012600 [Drosophila pseudoananassae]
MSDTTFFSSTASFTESENSLGRPAVASPQKSQNAIGPQSPVAAVASETAAPELSCVDVDDEENFEESAVEPNQVQPTEGPKEGSKANSTKVSTASMVEGRVYVKVLADKETLHLFKIKSSTKMARLMGAYSWKTSLPIDHFRFYYQGKMVDENDTVQSLALQPDSVIDALTDLEGWDDSYKQFLKSLFPRKHSNSDV